MFGYDTILILSALIPTIYVYPEASPRLKPQLHIGGDIIFMAKKVN